MTKDEFTLLNHLQDTIAKGLKAMEGEPGKSYEGALELHLAGKYEDLYSVILHCYLLGPGRHYLWQAKSLAAVLEGAAFTIQRWVDDPEGHFVETTPDARFQQYSMVSSTTYKHGVAQ